MIVDNLGRSFKNLRVSLTAACNYACTYCVPDGKRLMPARNELSARELLKLVGYIQEAAGIEKLRITGGDPLVTPKFDEFLLGVSKFPLRDISLTTNGQLLLQKAAVLKKSGIKRINISLDTLNPLKFKQIARGGDLDTVLAGIDKMLELGIKIKINMVPMRNQNLADVQRLLEYSLQRGIELRFIELMRMGHLLHGSSFQQEFLSMQAILDEIAKVHSFQRADAPFDSTAVRFHIPGKGYFGVIANESEPFCTACTRLRISSDGYLYGCLSSSRRQPLSELLEMPRYLVLPKLQGLLLSALGDKQLSFKGETTVMKFIGG